MPTYTIQGDDMRPDQTVHFDAPDFEQARAKLFRTAGQTLTSESHEDAADLTFWNFDLTDDSGLVLFSLTIQGFASPAVRQ